MAQQTIRGFRFPAVPWFKKENIEETLDYVPHDDDIIVASYPKTGTTWLGYIVLQIVSKGENFPNFTESLRKDIPFLEMTGTSAFDDVQGPRIFKHHCPYNMMQKNPKAKYLYIYRNPADVIVSFYHFTNQLADAPQSFDEFFERFLTGDISYEGYFQHVLSYWNHRHDEGMLLVSYEKLHANRKEEILRIAKFLGEEYFQNLLEDESVLEKIIEHTSFEYMKKNLSLEHPGSVEKDDAPKEVVFFRKGTVGDGKNSLSPVQMERLREAMLDAVKGTDLIDEWSH